MCESCCRRNCSWKQMELVLLPQPISIKKFWAHPFSKTGESPPRLGPLTFLWTSQDDDDDQVRLLFETTSGEVWVLFACAGEAFSSRFFFQSPSAQPQGYSCERSKDGFLRLYCKTSTYLHARGKCELHNWLFTDWWKNICTLAGQNMQDERKYALILNIFKFTV